MSIWYLFQSVGGSVTDLSGAINCMVLQILRFKFFYRRAGIDDNAVFNEYEYRDCIFRLFHEVHDLRYIA